jgi:GT2 family glycosyltransferase
MEGHEELRARLQEKEEWIDHLEETIEECQSELTEAHARLQYLESVVDLMTGSLSWKLTQQVAAVVGVVAPPGSARRQLLHVGYRGVRALPKLRHRQYVAHKLRVALNRARGRLGLLLYRYGCLAERLLGSGWLRRKALAAPPRFPAPGQVEVSIIIPVFNHCRDTLACLESIARQTDRPAYEVIVVDDGSSDETPAMLAQVEGLVAVRNEQNLGFIGSCNRGAAAARGDYLVFLNNDTLVTPGWLDALAQTFRDIPGTGLAGAKLVYPDGRLQEAGGVIWRDASGWNYGKHDDADHPRYNFAREVDYCSGACLMVPRALFEQLGGFDTVYRPAYYEDTDLAFKVRHAGHKVVYQPLAKVVHLEGLTSGRSVTSGVKSYQVVNRTKFLERWHDRLASHPEPQNGPYRVVHAHGPAPGAGRLGQVLVIDHRLPTPDRDCGSVRMVEILRAVRNRGHHVTLIPDNLAVASPYHETLQGMGVEVVHHPYYRSVAAYLKQYGREFDLAILSRAEIAGRHMATVRHLCPAAKIVFDTVDLHYLREEREARLNSSPALRASVAERKQQELRLARRSDMTLVVSPYEQALLRKECHGTDVRILSTIYPLDEAEPPGYDGRRDIVFIGGFEHPPNVDAVLYFVREIFPRVRARIPEAVFQVIGPDPTPEIRQLAGADVRVLGYVPDVRPLFDRARLSVAPIRFGAGVKGKVNQSMSFGVPTVVTSVAAEGMYLTDGRNALIADDPESFADAVVQLWTSRELWESVSSSGRCNLREHFSVATAVRRVDELLAWAGLSGSGGGVPAPHASPAPVHAS